MSIAHDATTLSAALTSSGSFTHTPVGTPRGVICVLTQPLHATAQVVDGDMDYGGVDVPLRVSASRVVGENMRSDIFFVGSGIPTGPQTVTVTFSNGVGANARVRCYTVTAAADTTIVDFDSLSTLLDDPSITLDNPSALECYIVAALCSGEGATGDHAAGSAYTSDGAVDPGLATSRNMHITTPTTSTSIVVDFTTTNTEDVAMVAIAIAEVAGGTTYQRDVAEPADVSDAYLSPLTARAADAEAVDVSDAALAKLTARPAVIESVTMGAAAVATIVMNMAITQAITLGEDSEELLTPPPSTDVISSTDLGAATRFIELAGSILNDMPAYTVLTYHRPTAGGGENGSGVFMSKTPTSSLIGPRFACSHNSNAPRYTMGIGSGVSSGTPNAVSSNSTVTYGSWQHAASIYRGGILGTSNELYRGIGVDLTETSYSSRPDGSGSVISDAADPMYLMNRLGLDRAFVGDIAYVAVWRRALTARELLFAQNGGPLNVRSDLVFVYANGQIYDPNGTGVTIATRSTRVTGALPTNTALGGGILVDEEFERSSVNVYQSGVIGEDDSAIVEIWPRMQNNETVLNSPRWLVPVARITGVNGKRPTFRFMSYGSGANGYWQHPFDAAHRPRFAYTSDLTTWFVMTDDFAINASNITFRYGTAFTEDSIIVAAHPIYTCQMYADWVASITAANPDKIKNVPSNISGFVSGTFAPQTDEMGRTIPSQDFYAFKISDDAMSPPAGQRKRAMVLVNGVHAGEDMARYAFKAAVEFLLTEDAAEADLLRSNFEIYCYGLVNAPGIAGGGFRGGFVTDGDGKNDANRNFNNPTTTLEIVTLPRAAMLMDLPAVKHVAIDWHQQWSADYEMYTNGDTGPTFLAQLNDVMFPLVVTDVGPSTDGSVTDWMGENGAIYYTTSEIGEVTQIIDLTEIAEWGLAWMFTVRNLINDDLIPFIYAVDYDQPVDVSEVFAGNRRLSYSLSEEFTALDMIAPTHRVRVNNAEPIIVAAEYTLSLVFQSQIIVSTTVDAEFQSNVTVIEVEEVVSVEFEVSATLISALSLLADVPSWDAPEQTREWAAPEQVREWTYE
jgi:hypothetical protein